MAFKVTWHGKETYHGRDFTFAPGESRYYESREHVPHEVFMEYRFKAEAVPHEEAFPPQTVDDDGEFRARGTVPSSTDVPPPDEDSD